MKGLLREVRLAARALRRAPGFTIAAVLTLAAGIGATTLVFMIADAVLFRSLPFRDAERIVSVSLITRDTPKYPLSIQELLEYGRETRSLAGMAAVAGSNMSLTGSGDAERLQGVRASGNLFPLLGVDAAIGRTLLPEDDRTKASVVVLTEGLWRRHFGGDPRILGRSIVLNGDPYEIVGILPPAFRFMTQSAEFAIPLAAEQDPARSDRRGMGMLRVVARLAPGKSAEQAAAEMTAMAKRLQKQYPDSNATKQGMSVTPYRDDVVGPVRPMLLTLLGAVVCVFLIGCANLAGLALVRAAGRSREMAVRAALGATRWQVGRQIVIETLLLGCGGGVLGFLLVIASSPFLSALKPRLLPRAHEIGVDLRVAAFSAFAAVLAALLVGLWPALQASSLALSESIKGSGSLASGQTAAMGRTARSRTRRLLVGTEVALSMLLLAGAGLFLRSFERLLAVDPGFDSRNVLIARLALPKLKYGNPEALAQFHDRLRPMLASLPGVKSAGMISIAPLSGALGSADFWDADHPPADPHAVEAAHYRVIGEGCFKALGMRLIQGREFTASDDAHAPPVVIVNQRLVDLTFPGTDPIGKYLMIDDGNPRRLEIVGVVADVRHEGVDLAPVPDVHVPLAQLLPGLAPYLANNQFWALRTAGDPRPLARAVQVAVREVDPDVAASDLRTLDDYVDDATGTRRLGTWLVGLFAIGALFLAALGLYGLVAFSVSQRTREIGIRMALGAREADVQRLVVGEAVRLTAAGLFAGLAAALLLTRLMSGLLYEVQAHDPLTYAAVGPLLALVTLVASWLPARRAARVDPTRALRAE